jgi:hypothetical protein
MNILFDILVELKTKFSFGKSSRSFSGLDQFQGIAEPFKKKKMILATLLTILVGSRSGVPNIGDARACQGGRQPLWFHKVLKSYTQ